MSNRPLLHKLRSEYQPPVPAQLKQLKKLQFVKKEIPTQTKDVSELKKLFPKTFGQPLIYAEQGQGKQERPLRVGVVFSGGQASGGHNVIAGLFDALKTFHSESTLIGFLGGPSGMISRKTREIKAEELAHYRNQGGFDLIGSGRTKIETEEQLQSTLAAVKQLKLDGCVVIGGDDSNTNAAILAEYFLTHGCETRVIGVPKTIDGDLKNAYLATSFGFDTACKVYSEMIGNIARDALSAKKYTHFIRLMGRSASHIALECALVTHPNITLIGEEVAAKKKTLKMIAHEIADVIEKRSASGKDYGIVLVPEGLIEFIPEVKTLIGELNNLAAKNTLQSDQVMKELTEASRDCFASLPEQIRKQLLLDRDPHGNVQVSLIETERLLIELVSSELKTRSFKGKFNGQNHFFGYEGRAGYPSNFDAKYCYALGQTAALLIHQDLTGYMCAVQDLHRPTEEWKILGIPLTLLMHLELRKGKPKPVIEKALVDLKGHAFSHFQKEREKWALADDYQYQGPIQFYGEMELTDSIPLSVSL